MEKFVKKRPYLFWSTQNYQGLSKTVVLENTLNYGDWADVQELFKILGIKKAAQIFTRESAKKRVNYRPEIAHYFKLYFHRYAR